MTTTTTSSSPNPSFQDTLLELYNGRDNKDTSIDNTGGSSVVVHGNGRPFHPPTVVQNQNNNNHPGPAGSSASNSSSSRSLFLYPGNNKRSVSNSNPTTYQRVQQPQSNTNNNNNNSSSISSPRTSTKKKRIGSNYHFLPMIGRSKDRRHLEEDSDSDCDEGYDEYHEYYGGYDNGKTNNNSNNNSNGNNSLNELQVNNGHGHPTNTNYSNNNKEEEDDGTEYLSDQEALRDIFTTSVAFHSKHHFTSHEKQSSSASGGDEHFTDGSPQKGPLHVRNNAGRMKNDNSKSNNNSSNYHQGDKDQKNNNMEQPFTSPLGRRIWRQYQQHQQQHQLQLQQPSSFPPHNPPIPSYHHLPSPNFLRLPSPTLLLSIPHPSSSSSNNNKLQSWMDVNELERNVIQCHLDLEAEDISHPNNNNNSTAGSGIGGSGSGISDSMGSLSSSSSLLTTKVFTKLLHRHPNVGLGMSLREYNGSVYIQALLRVDGSRYTDTDTEDDNYGKEEENAGPAKKAGLQIGDRLLGLNGQPFLKGRQVAPTTTQTPNANATVVTSSMSTNNGNSGNYNGGRHHATLSCATRQPRATSEDVLKSIGECIANAPSPMALHVQRAASPSDREKILKCLKRLQSEYKDRVVDTSGSGHRTMNNKGGSLGGTPPRRSHAPPPAFTTPPKPTLSPPPPVTKQKRSPTIHPFAKALSQRSLLKSTKEELLITRQIRIFTDRTRQWESKLAFRLRASDFTLRPLLDARDVEPSYYASFFLDDGECPPYFDYKGSKSIRSYGPSTPLIGDWRLTLPEGHLATPPLPAVGGRRDGRGGYSSKEAAIMADLYAGLDDNDAYVQNLMVGGKNSVYSNGSEGGVAYPRSNNNISGSSSSPLSLTQAAMNGHPTDIFVPLVGVRKAICVRILNSFLDNRNRTAFTIWCYDVESGMEWYAPVRYYNDFKDLRSALIRVDKTIADIPFPSLGWTLGFTSSEAKESQKTKEVRRSQLEGFLRRCFAGVYRGRLHPYLAEVAVHLQTFVGCDTVLTNDNGFDSSLSLSKQVAISESSYGKRTPDPKSEPDNNARMQLKRSIMRYVYRLFLLPAVEELISQFVNAAKEKVNSEAFMGPTTTTTTRQQSHQFSVDKGVATKDVEKIRDFIDQVQELILEGCREDFVSMSTRRDFCALVDDGDNSVRDDLFREAVREQTELEVYVPLRSTISKYLVYAWFNEDMEMKHKMKALADKPQSYFRIPKEHRSRSDWKSVSNILKEGVGRSTLPCVKLRAVVDAAKEITQLDSEERSVFPDASFFDGKVVTKSKALGADDFLPIFIFCFVQAKIERPSALCELLSVMCDPRKMSGEMGYYLASFHAALTHIRELDLTEAENDLSIIFDS